MADNLYIPQVDYTSRDYASIRADLISLIPNFAPQWTSRDASDFGIVLLELFSYMGDLMNYYIDRAANESFLSTATQRDTVLKIAKLLNYSPNEPTPSIGAVTFTNQTAANVVIPALTQVATSPDGTGNQLIFETDSAVTVPVTGDKTISSNVTQGVTVLSEQVGTSIGSPNQSFKISKSGVISKSVYVTVNSISYTRVSSLLDYGSTDPVFTTFTDATGYTYVRFGDGISGRVPPSNGVIYVTYRVGVGSAGNVGSGSIATILQTSSGLTISGVTVSQAAATSGGADAESTDSIRINAPLAIKTLNRAVSLKDYGQLAVQVPGVAKAIAVSSSYTAVTVYIAASGGTSASANLLAAVKSFFISKTPPNTTVTVLDYTKAYPYLSISVNIKNAYNAATVNKNVTQAINDLFSFNNVTLNDLISVSDVYTAVSAIDGVINSNIAVFEKTLLATGYSAGTSVTDFSCNVNEVPTVVSSYINVTTVGGTN